MNSVGGSVTWNLDVDGSKFTSGLNKARAEAQTAGKDIDRSLSKTMSNVATSVGNSATYVASRMAIVGAAFGVLGKQALDSASNYQQSRIAFDTMLGSADRAKVLMKDISDFAKTTPFQLTEVVQGSKALLAYGISADKLIPTFRALGNIAAGVGKDKLPQLTLAFGQVRAAGKLTGMELRQFTEAGVPLLEELGKVTGKTAAQIKEDMESGAAPSFEVVEKALFNMSKEGGRFFNLMEKQSLTFSGRMSNIADSVGISIRSMLGIDVEGNVRPGSLFEDLINVAEKAMKWLQDHEKDFTKAFQTTYDFIKKNGDTIAVFIGTILAGAFIAWGAAAIYASAPILIVAGFVTILYTELKKLADKMGGWGALWDTFKTKIQPIVDVLNLTLIPALKFLWSVITTLVIPAMQTLWEKHGKEIILLFKLLGGSVGLVLLAILLQITASLIVLSLAFGAIISVITAVISFFKWLGDAITNAGASFGNAIRTMVGDIMRFGASVGVGVAMAVRFFAELPSRITGLFSQAGRWLYDAGVEIVNGLIRGIKSAYNQAVAYVKGLGDSIKAGFRASLEIKSPSKVFMQYGKYITQGLSMGMDSGMSGVNAQMNALVQPVVAPSSSGDSITNSSSATTNIGTIIINKDADADKVLAKLTRDDEVLQRGLIPVSNYGARA